MSLDLLIPTKVYTLAVNGTQGYYHALFFDGTKEYFGREHLPYGILAVMVVVILYPVTYTSILILFPFRFFQVILSRLPFNAAPLFIFVDKFQGRMEEMSVQRIVGYSPFSTSCCVFCK